MNREELKTDLIAKIDALTDLIAKIDALQVWFAAKPYGWRETATPDQLQQWEDRSREQDYLISRLEMLVD